MSTFIRVAGTKGTAGRGGATIEPFITTTSAGAQRPAETFMKQKKERKESGDVVKKKNLWCSLHRSYQRRLHWQSNLCRCVLTCICLQLFLQKRHRGHHLQCTLRNCKEKGQQEIFFQEGRIDALTAPSSTTDWRYSGSQLCKGIWRSSPLCRSPGIRMNISQFRRDQ